MLSTLWAHIIYVITLQLSTVFILFLGSFIFSLFSKCSKCPPPHSIHAAARFLTLGAAHLISSRSGVEPVSLNLSRTVWKDPDGRNLPQGIDYGLLSLPIV